MLTNFRALAVEQAGFTLAELLVSLGVGALLLSVGVPSYSAFTQNARQVTSSNELLSSLHVARDIAITRNVRVTMCPSSSGTNCDAAEWSEGWILFVDGDGNRSVGPGETVERAAADLDPLDVNSEDFAQFLIYRPNGRVMVDDVRDNRGEFTLCDKRGSAHARVLIVDLSGRPRVSDLSADGSAPACPVAAG